MRSVIECAYLLSFQLAAAQLIAGTISGAQVQQVAATSGTTTQPVATLVKTVVTQATSMPSVTIPVSAVNLGNVNISVSVPQQKASTGMRLVHCIKSASTLSMG